MVLPKTVKIFIFYHSIERVRFLCILKGKMIENHCKKDDSKSKYIGLERVIRFCLVCLADMNFRCHVSFFGTLVVGGSRGGADISSKTEVTDFKGCFRT